MQERLLQRRIDCSVLTLNSERILLFAGDGTDSTHRKAFLFGQSEREKGALSNVARISRQRFELRGVRGGKFN